MLCMEILDLGSGRVRGKGVSFSRRSALTILKAYINYVKLSLRRSDKILACILALVTSGRKPAVQEFSFSLRAGAAHVRLL